MITLVAIVAVALSISFLCSFLEAVFLSVSHAHVALLKSQGQWAGTWLEKARQNVEEPIAAILTLNAHENYVQIGLPSVKAMQTRKKVLLIRWVAYIYTNKVSFG